MYPGSPYPRCLVCSCYDDGSAGDAAKYDDAHTDDDDHDGDDDDDMSDFSGNNSDGQSGA